MSLEKIVFIVGPTAIGKNKVALELSKVLPMEIISCDSMQIYRELSIASNKPSVEELQMLPHHLVDVVSIDEEFDVAQYNHLALATIEQIHARRKMPVIVGGSGMYMQVLLDGIFAGPGKNQALRKGLEEKIVQQGKEALYRQLQDLDPEAAAKIHPQDARRIMRALEVVHATRQPISQIQRNRSGLWDKYDVKIFGLNCPREKLYDQINRRVEEMFEKGIVQEIQQLASRTFAPTAQALIGVKEIQGFLRGEYDLDQAKYLLKLNTRHLAKRQLTWFRKERRIRWLELNPGDPVDKIAKFIVQEIG